MKTRRWPLIFVLAVAAALFFLNRRQVTLSAQDSVELKRISGSGYELSSVLRLYNPNLLSSTIKSIHEKFVINGTPVGELNMELDQGIPGLRESQLPVSARFSREEAQEAFGDSAAGSFALTITGEIVFQNLAGGGTIAVQIKDSVLYAE